MTDKVSNIAPNAINSIISMFKTKDELYCIVKEVVAARYPQVASVPLKSVELKKGGVNPAYYDVEFYLDLGDRLGDRPGHPGPFSIPLWSLICPNDWVAEDKQRELRELNDILARYEEAKLQKERAKDKVEYRRLIMKYGDSLK